MNKSGSATAAPIFVRRVGVEDFWTVLGCEPHQNSVRLARHWIVLIEIKKWEQRCLEKPEPVWASKARVEIAAARSTRDVCKYAVQRASILFINVKTFVEELA